MNSLKQIITNIFTKPLPVNVTTRPLGRWSVETCSKKINHKIKSFKFEKKGDLEASIV